jgi:hypothetical protein
MMRATRAPITSAEATLRPSGSRTTTSNCARSSTGKKPLRAAPPIGPIETSASTEAPTTIHRWRITNESTLP